MVVVDSAGARVKLACVNWYGAHMEGHVVNGLDRRSVEGIATTIASLGFNCVRLPFSLEQFYDNPLVEDARLTANPELKGQTSLEVLEAVVTGLTEAGLMVILNNHNRSAATKYFKIFLTNISKYFSITAGRAGAALRMTGRDSGGLISIRRRCGSRSDWATPIGRIRPDTGL